MMYLENVPSVSVDVEGTFPYEAVKTDGRPSNALNMVLLRQTYRCTDKVEVITNCQPDTMQKVGAEY
jgi:hypothetical protein